tara:strand:+ start:3116 stop:3661 length:546 start_codon:yes stop_codon:yes gene_type:complete
MALHFVASLFGLLITFYELNFIGNRVIFQYSGWFLISSTLLHIYQILFKPPNVYAYNMVVIGLGIVLPAAIPSLISFNYNLTSYLLYDVGNHIIMPFCTIFHLNNTIYKTIVNSFLFITIYNLLYALTLEFGTNKKPYKLLDDFNLSLRIVLYFGLTFYGYFLLFLLTKIPFIRNNQLIRV